MKKIVPNAPSTTEFRESDFAGMNPNDQARLNVSLNRLSGEMQSTRQLLQEMEPIPPAINALRPAQPGEAGRDESPSAGGS